MKKRIDVLLVEKKFFDSRAKAVMAINSGVVEVCTAVSDYNDCNATSLQCDYKVVHKPSEKVDENAEIKIVGNTMPFVSRGGLKLEGAIKEFGLDFNGKVVLDMGASTGGFTDCALVNGARKVIAVDVGSNQLAQKLREDVRVVSIENTDVKSLSKAVFDEVDVIVADISFVSIVKIVQGIIDKITTQEIMLLIKPQFECGLEMAKKCKGVIKDIKLCESVANNTIQSLQGLGLKLLGVAKSPICGGDGNTEFITLFKKV